MATDNANAGAASAGPLFGLRYLFIKDVSYEAPNVPGILYGHEQPELQFSVETSHKHRERNVFEVVLQVTVHAKAADKSLFLIEVQQGGLFEISGYSSEDTNAIIKTKAPEALYPYARELISSLVGRGGFPQVHLRPIDFEALYAESQRAAADKA